MIGVRPALGERHPGGMVVVRYRIFAGFLSQFRGESALLLPVEDDRADQAMGWDA